MQRSEQAAVEVDKDGSAQADAGQEEAGWTQDEFNAWASRMGLKTNPAIAAATGISSETARSYSNGKRAVPAYIRVLCQSLEQLRKLEGGMPAGASDAEMVARVAQGYVDEVRRRRPLSALVADVGDIAQMFAASLARNGLVLAREQDVGTD